MSALPKVLRPDMILAGYCQGIFPMAVNLQGDIGWFSPDPRAVIPLDDAFHVPHGLRKTLKKGKFEITIDQEFEEVIVACSKAHGDTWISKEIIQNYCWLHYDGYAHSIETRLDGKLVGGLYGVALGAAFFGESMFHRATDASKVALVELVNHLRNRGFQLLDTQWMTPHLEQFGTQLIPKTIYLRRLREALTSECDFK